MSLNQMLRDTQLVLRNLKQTLQQGFGYSVFDNEQIIDKYSKFVKKWKEIGKPELYFLALDIKKCYDSINAQKLLELFLQTDLLVSSHPFSFETGIKFSPQNGFFPAINRLFR